MEQRFKVGFVPPPQPELRSSPSAPLLRAPEETPISDIAVIYAGKSKRRKSFLEYSFPTEAHIDVPGGDEPDIPDVIAITQGKLDHVLPHVLADESIRRSTRVIALVAADTRTNTLTTSESGHTYLKSRGKPQKARDVQDTFRQMSQAAQRENINPYYTVVSASGLHHIEGRREERLIAKHVSTIQLDPKALQHLASDEGFQQYLTAFKEFYVSPPYVNNGQHNTLDVTDLSSGLSLPVLAKMGIVTSIDEVSRSDKTEFRNAFIQALLNAAVGISPHVLKPLNPDIEERISHWSWAQEVADHTLGKTSDEQYQN